MRQNTGLKAEEKPDQIIPNPVKHNSEVRLLDLVYQEPFDENQFYILF
jgi:hypothetical protein